MKTGVAVSMISVRRHCHRANASVVCAIISSSHDRIVIAMQNFAVAYKDSTPVIILIKINGNFHRCWSQWTHNVFIVLYCIE